MSVAEIKSSLESLSVEERLDVAAWIAYLNRSSDPDYQAELDARMAQMDAGKKFTKADLERLHAELNARGQ